MRFHAQTGKIRAIHFANLSQPTVQNREGDHFCRRHTPTLKRLAGWCKATAKVTPLSPFFCGVGECSACGCWDF